MVPAIASSQKRQNQERPDSGFCGDEINTPNLDQLAGGGRLFTEFYEMGRCRPMRASLPTFCLGLKTGRNLDRNRKRMSG